MDTLPVILIFAICIFLLLGAYIVTAVRCTRCCLRGLKAKLAESSNEMPFSTITVVDGLAEEEPNKSDAGTLTETEMVTESLSAKSVATECDYRISIDETPNNESTS